MSEKKIKYSPDHTFFTSDTHFGHANIIRFCNRPFRNVEEMNEALIENWNLVVSEDDTVFHLGDFAFGGSNVWKSIIPRLNGHINLIIGNMTERILDRDICHILIWQYLNCRQRLRIILSI